MFYYFHKVLVIKKRQGLALPFLQLTTYETQSPPVLMTVGALSFTAGQGTDAVYTPEEG